MRALMSSHPLWGEYRQKGTAPPVTSGTLAGRLGVRLWGWNLLSGAACSAGSLSAGSWSVPWKERLVLEGSGLGLPCSIAMLATVFLDSVSGLGQDVILPPDSALKYPT